MATITKTVRFTSEELDLIEQFLEANPFLDFSGLVRIATTTFVRKPQLPVRAVSPKYPRRAARKEKEADNG